MRHSKRKQGEKNKSGTEKRVCQEKRKNGEDKRRVTIKVKQDGRKAKWERKMQRQMWVNRLIMGSSGA